MGVENRGPNGCSFEGDREWKTIKLQIFKEQEVVRKSCDETKMLQGDMERRGFSRHTNLAV